MHRVLLAHRVTLAHRVQLHYGHWCRVQKSVLPTVPLALAPLTCRPLAGIVGKGEEAAAEADLGMRERGPGLARLPGQVDAQSERWRRLQQTSDEHRREAIERAVGRDRHLADGSAELRPAAAPSIHKQLQRSMTKKQPLSVPKI